VTRRDLFYGIVKGALEAKGGRDVYLHDIYRSVKLAAEDECDDSEPCEHKGHTYVGPEWWHDVRWALQDLKADGAAGNGAERGYWHST
jgi:hypothetical protein